MALPAAPLPSLGIATFGWGRAAPHEAFDSSVRELMRRAAVPGLTLAVFRGGRLVYRQAYGQAGPALAGGGPRPLRTDSVMRAASLTKATFAWLVMQLVDEGLVDLDIPLPRLLPKPLPDYPEFADLAGDERWRALTLRQLLSHTSGLLNWRFINLNNKLDFKYAPGERVVYSGEGIQIAQLVVETVTGQSLNELMAQRVFQPLKMADTRLTWDDRFRERVVMGYGEDGALKPPPMPRRPRAAGSMLTTLDDYASFFGTVLRREGLSPAAHRQMLRGQKAIVSPKQFPSHWPGQTDVNAPIGLASGLGWVVYRAPQGRAFFKEGHDDGVNNFALGFADTGDGLLVLANSSRGESIFLPLVELIWPTSCLPWFWMGYVPYDQPQWLAPDARNQPQGPGAACLKALPGAGG